MRTDRMTFAGCALPALVLGIGLIASWEAFGADVPSAPEIPSAYDHPFRDWMIIEQEAYNDVLADGRCQHAWDVGATRMAVACSWHFDDPLNPGRQACHVVYPRLEDGVWTREQEVEAIRIETANCNGWHDGEVRAFGELEK